MGRVEALEALCLRLGTPAVAREVLLAAQEPAQWIARHGDDRNITRAKPGLAMVALIDALSRARRAVELDWKWPFDDTRAQLERLPGFPRGKKKRLWSQAAKEPLAEWLRTEGQLALCAELLAKEGMALLRLPFDADAVAAVLVPAKEAAELGRQFRAAGLPPPERLDLAAALADARARMDEAEAQERREQQKRSRAWRHFILPRGAKLWVIRYDGRDLHVGEGVAGKDRPRRVRAADAMAEMERQVAARTAKGYREVDLSWMEERKLPTRVFVKGKKERTLFPYPRGVDITIDGARSSRRGGGKERDAAMRQLAAEWKKEGFKEIPHLQHLVEHHAGKMRAGRED